MSKEIVKKEAAKPVKIFSPEEIRMMVADAVKNHFGMENKIKKICEKQLPDYSAGKDDSEKTIDDLIYVSRASSLESGYVLAESVNDFYQGLAFQMKKEFHEEFDCKMASEKALVDLAVSSYISKLYYTKLLSLNQKDAGSDYNGYRNSASKEIDRAHRQFISAIETLRFMKQPSLKVNVRTNNAFIGEKQQFNTNQIQKDENNEAK